MFITFNRSFIPVLRITYDHGHNRLVIIRYLENLLQFLSSVNGSYYTFYQGCSKSNGMCRKHNISCINHPIIRMSFSIFGCMYGYDGWGASGDSIPMVKLIDSLLLRLGIYGF